MEEYDLRDVSYEKLNRGYETQWELMDDLFAWLDLRIYFFYEHHQWLGPKNDMRNMMGLVVSRGRPAGAGGPAGRERGRPAGGRPDDHLFQG